MLRRPCGIRIIGQASARVFRHFVGGIFENIPYRQRPIDQIKKHEQYEQIDRDEFPFPHDSPGSKAGMTAFNRDSPDESQTGINVP